MSKFDDLLDRVKKTPDKSLPRAIRAVAAKYDDLILECSVIPDEGIRFLLALFSDIRVLHSRGIEHFLLEINVDFHKYTQDQRDRLLSVLIDGASHISDQLGRHSVGDLIARAYPSDVAFKALEEIAKRGLLGRRVAFAGFDVLRMQRSKDVAFHEKVMCKWRELQS